MMIHDDKNGLKGQHNLAQGKRSVALGLKTDMKIVRVKRFIKKNSFIRTKFIYPFYGSYEGSFPSEKNNLLCSS